MKATWLTAAAWACLGLYNPGQCASVSSSSSPKNPREKISINKGWHFRRFETNPDGVIYDHRPDLENLTDVAVLKPWILPSGNDYIVDPADRHDVPDEAPPGQDIPYISKSFDDGEWELVRLPHDYAINGPFYTEEDPPVGGGMGRLPVQGVAWYRRRLSIGPADKAKSIYLEIEGAMSYSMVWLNGHLVGGWPYGYNSYQLDLTPYLEPGDENLLAIRTDNPLDSARWYPGGGLFRNVWLNKVNPTHIGYQGTYITASDISTASATINLQVHVENSGGEKQKVKTKATLFEWDSGKGKVGTEVAQVDFDEAKVSKGEKATLRAATNISNPQLWGPPPTQTPSMYMAVVELSVKGKLVDRYETKFAVRETKFDANEGFFINGEHLKFRGVNEHHDLGALGAAFNRRAAERKLEMLRELGVNSIRMSHNPPATGLLELTDEMGFLVIDEIFDSWRRNKTDSDFHLIFNDWHEADARNFVRRDRNHPSVIAWSFGNEVGEQYEDEDGAAVGKMLHDIFNSEDPTRPTTASMNYAKPDMPFGHSMDFLSINYQGSGIRDTPNYSNLEGVRTQPLYPAFHEAFPEKMIIGSETASTLSTRGTFIFPVVAQDSGAPVNETSGGNETTGYVSAYELYTAGFGSPPDKVFVHQDRNPFVAGEFVWTGFDYIGEPTPYYDSRSSYCGIIDLAGFKKDRFWIYQSRWRPDIKTAHILPHWNWPDRVGEVTPVHVFSAADEAELFVNGESQGRIARGDQQYRFRWDQVEYQAGEVRVETWKDGEPWAEQRVQTTGEAKKLRLTADRSSIAGDGLDLAYVTVEVLDEDNRLIPTADNEIEFAIQGPGEVVATDNGDPADMVSFDSLRRKTLGGLALAIIKTDEGARGGEVVVTAQTDGLEEASAIILAA